MHTFYFIIAICDLSLPLLLLGLIGPFILGYLLRRFIDSEKRERIAKLESENNALQAEIAKSAGYKANWHSTDHENKKLLASVNKYEADVARLKADVDAANKKYLPFIGVDVDALRSKINSLEAHNTSLQSSINELSGTASSLEDVQANANAMKDRFTYLESENARLKIDLKAALAAKDSVVRSNENVGKMKEEIREMSGKIGGFTVESERLKKETADAKAAAKAAQDELDLLKASASTTQADADKAKSIVQDYENKIKTLEANLQTAKANADNNATLQEELKTIKAKLADAEINASSARLKVEELQKENAALAAKPPVEKIVEKIVEVEKEVPATVMASTVAATPDDLKVVEGIGPKVEQLFIAKGITTYKQLADMSKEQVEEVLQTGGERFRILNGNSWPKQAALLRDGKMQEFEAYTDYLIAGVDPNEMKSTADATVKVDDLKIVEGIGPKIEGLLNVAGIYSFKQLSESSVDTLKEILHNAGSRYQIHDPSTWPQQAKLADEGKMDELQKLQDALKGGRVE